MFKNTAVFQSKKSQVNQLQKSFSKISEGSSTLTLAFILLLFYIVIIILLILLWEHSDTAL